MDRFSAVEDRDHSHSYRFCLRMGFLDSSYQPTSDLESYKIILWCTLYLCWFRAVPTHSGSCSLDIENNFVIV